MKLPRWELKHTADPLDTRAYAGGGGDGGAGEMRAAEEERQRKVQAAVDAINARFGMGPQGGSSAPAIGSAPDKSQFQLPGRQWIGEGENMQLVDAPGGFDEARYNAALADYNARKAAAEGAVVDASGAKAAREAQYTDIANAVRDTAMRDVDRQYSQASRRNTFGLARSGLLGGSADAESGGQLKELYGEGRIKAQQQGLQASADLRTQDEKTRQNLISLAQSGLDTGTAASMAANQMASAADAARGAAGGATVGRLFDDLSQAYVVNQVAKARYPQQASQQPSGYGTNVFGTSRYTGTVGR